MPYNSLYKVMGSLTTVARNAMSNGGNVSLKTVLILSTHKL